MAAAQEAQQPAIMPDAPPLNEFEQQRVENIARNHTMLASLGVPLAAKMAVGPATPAAQGKQAASTMHRDPGKQQVPAGASHKGGTVARDSKGKFIGSSSRRRRARMTAGPLQSSWNFGGAMPILSSGSASPGTFKRQQSSGVTVPVVDGSLASSIACDMATWMQHEERNAEIAAGGWLAGSHQQAGEHPPEGPSEACAAGSHGEHAALVFPEALVNLGCEVSLEAAPPGVVPGHLFGTAMIPSKGGKKRKAVVATPSGASHIADET